jgi:hypothetical protein
MRLESAGVLAVLLTFAAAASCSSKPPELVSTSARVIAVAVDADGNREERLSFFASVADGDGTGDIEYLFLVNDALELSWTLDRYNWVQHEEGSSVWIGANGLNAPAGVIPRGHYRVVLVDSSGERVERTIVVSAPETGAYALPSARLDADFVVVQSPYPVSTALFLDSGGNVVASAAVSAGRTSLDTLMRGGSWRTSADYIAVYGFDPKAETGFMSWKIRLPD